MIYIHKVYRTKPLRSTTTTTTTTTTTSHFSQSFDSFRIRALRSRSEQAQSATRRRGARILKEAMRSPSKIVFAKIIRTIIGTLLDAVLQLVHSPT